MEDRVRQVLDQHFGFHDFRPGQEQIIHNTLQGHDTLGIMPTGGGKSLCYQLPALVLPGLTLVISPLIALMKDQVDALNDQGIAASYINSSLTSTELYTRLHKARQGDYKMLYIAPERLESEHFTDLLHELPLSLVAIDEAHCVSQWGHDFRPSYLSIGAWIETLPRRPVVAAFTATATPRVQKDIIKLLGLEQPLILINSFDRPNLYFSIHKGVDRTRFINRYLKEHPNYAGIVYAATRKEVESLFKELEAQGYMVGKYHAGLSNAERDYYQEAFIYDKIQVIIATNAFGLGIDKSNVRFVIHHNMPRHLEAYYQEAGRAGRDGQNADCILLYQAQDILIQKFLIEQSSRSTSRKDMEYDKLQSMIDYCHTTHCLRKYILEYFGEDSNVEHCNQCANCLERELRDITIEAQKIFSCIVRMKQPYGSKLIASVLKGSRQKRILDLGFDQLSTHGIMSELSIAQIVDLINLLAAEDYLSVSSGQYPVVSLRPKARPVLRSQEQVIVSLPKTPEAALPESSLFQALRALRLQIAQRQELPPYVIFPDTTLREMAARLPRDREAMLAINGVGQVKFERYGQQFLEIIRQYSKEPASSLDLEPNYQISAGEKKTSSPRKKNREPKTPTHIISWQEYQSGKTLAEIATTRNLSLSTIENHLLRAAQDGYEVDWNQFVTPEEEEQILAAARIAGVEKLRPIKDTLPDDISYFHIKITLFKNHLGQWQDKA
jgi:ATP-dependent DNA helicase RecQ